MLKAYDYGEPDQQTGEIQDAGLFRKEKGIALQYVLDNPNHIKERKCPVCGTAHTKFIFSRWDIDYLFCDECCSIFVPADKKTIKDYLNIEKMRELRICDPYESYDVRGNVGIPACRFRYGASVQRERDYIRSNSDPLRICRCSYCNL